MATARRGNGRQAVRNGGTPGWALFGGGVIVGAVLCALVVWGGYAPNLRRHDQPQPNPQATAPQPSAPGIADQSNKADTSKPTFDFYSVLPEKEVVIPDAELSAKAKAEQQRAKQQAQANAANNSTTASTPPPPAAEPGGSRYMLQVASVTDAKAADEYKARLAMLGFSAKIYQ